MDAASVWVANACDNPDKQAANVTKGVEETLSVSVENAYVAVCDAVVPGLPEFEASACAGSAACDTAKIRASQITRSCSAKVSVRTLAANTRKLADHENITPELRGAIRGLEAQLGTRESAGVSLVELANGSDAPSFLESYRAQQWSAVSVRVGLDGSVDFARRQFGTPRLELDEPGEPGQPEQLDDGSVLAWRAGPTALLKAGRLQTSVGVSGGQGAPVGSKDMFTFLQPSASLSWLIGFLNDEKIDREVSYRERIPSSTRTGPCRPTWSWERALR